MARAMYMPKIGMTEDDTKVVEFMKETGDRVEQGETLYSMEGDKVATEAESPVSGIVLKTYVEPGDMVPIGGLVMVIGEVGEDISEFESKSKVSGTGKQKERAVVEEAPTAVLEAPFVVSGAEKENVFSPKFAPAARKLAEQNGLDQTHIAKALGLTRRIQVEDVEAYIMETKASDSTSSASVSLVRIPATSTRKVIAKQMYASLSSMAQTTISVELDVTELVSFREALLSEREELGAKITMTDIFSFVTIKMLKTHPLANAEWRETEIVCYPYINLSIAVATEYGLMSPVIKDVGDIKLPDLSKAIAALVKRTRENKLVADDISGGTFTISNMGIYPVDSFTPIVNPPQSAILGFGRIVEKPAVYLGQIQIRKMMTLSLTYDHRVFDGSEAGGIASDMQRYLERPILLYQ